jgi:hypothetical protein
MWLTLTRADANVPVHVNMQLVTYMWRSTDGTSKEPSCRRQREARRNPGSCVFSGVRA